MAHFGPRSLSQLATCDVKLQAIAHRVITRWDCTILEGRRSWARQSEMLAQGLSKLGPGESKHNAPREDDDAWLSLAMDIAPYPIDWQDLNRFRVFGGFVLGVAWEMGIPLRWGGDWDGDLDLRDQRFHDLPHVELVNT